MSDADRFYLTGVMGSPVMHSRSPKLHGYWLQHYGITGAYLPLAIPAVGLAKALQALPALGFAGCNLTIPHKETALTLVDSVDAEARRIGAINCVVVEADGRLAGYNNDGFGYVQSILEAEPNWRADEGPIVVLGAGGGARAILVSLCDRGAKDILLANRTAERAQALASEFGAPLRAIAWSDRHRALDGAAMLINTTSQGMVGQPELDLDLSRLPTRALVSDIVYIPRQTKLLASAVARGNRTINGLGMLLHQARPAFRAWFGILPEVTPALRALIEATL
jgi:shikimate dehydrogenase